MFELFEGFQGRLSDVFTHEDNTSLSEMLQDVSLKNRESKKKDYESRTFYDTKVSKKSENTVQFHFVSRI